MGNLRVLRLWAVEQGSQTHARDGRGPGWVIGNRTVNTAPTMSRPGTLHSVLRTAMGGCLLLFSQLAGRRTEVLRQGDS